MVNEVKLFIADPSSRQTFEKHLEKFRKRMLLEINAIGDELRAMNVAGDINVTSHQELRGFRRGLEHALVWWFEREDKRPLKNGGIAGKKLRKL